MEKKKLSDKKKLIIGIIAFSLALITAIAAFSYGLTAMGEKTEGFQEVPSKIDKDALLYSDGITLMYYCLGSSNSIKHQINDVQSVFSVPLASIFKQTDNRSEYDGVVNLATICASPSAPLPVSDDLYAILKDAYAKTLEGKGYNVFAGALNAEWEMLHYLDDPAEFDPAADTTEGERINKLAAATADMSNFSLEFGSGTVKLTVSKEYTDLLASLEINAPILDLGLLRDAYEIEYVASVMKKSGYVNGYFYTRSGLFLNLGAGKPVYYEFSGYENGKTTKLGYLTSESAGACSYFKAFSESGEDHSSYSVNIGGREYLRHMYFRQSDGMFSDVVVSSMVYSKAGGAVAVCYSNIVANNQTDGEAVKTFFASDTSLECLLTISGGATDVVVIPESSACFTLYTKE